MPEVGSASLAIIPSFKGFQGELERGSTKALGAAGVSGGAAFGDSAGKAASGKFSQRMKSLGKVAALGLAGAAAGALKFSADAVRAASDIEESGNKLNQVFGPASKQITDFSAEAAKSLGQTNLEARNAAATFGIYGKAANLTNKQNAKFAKQMTTLASDLASFHNVDPAQAVEALGSAFRGEAEPMRQFGVLMDADTLKAEALAEGLVKPVKDMPKIQGYRIQMIEGQRKVNEAIEEFGAKSFEAEKAQANLGATQGRLAKALDGTVPALTQEQKILAARSLILKQTSDAQGDFTRTSDGLANQQRILKARWEDSKIALGEVLLPVINDAVKFLNDKGIPAFEKFSDWFIEDGIPAIKDFGGFVKDDILPPVKQLLEYLNDLPKPAKYAGLVALLGGVGAMKLRGGALGGGGALGTAGKVLGLAKPVPVIVMNKGFGAGGGVPPVVTGTPMTKAGKVAKFGGKALKAVPFVGATLLAGEVIGEDYDKFAGKGGGALGLGGGIREMAERAKGVETYAEAWKGVETMVDRAHPKIQEGRHQVKLFGDAVKGVPPEKTVKVKVDGVREARALLAGLGADLDWISRPREARITITRRYAKAGYQTVGGLQETTQGGTTGGTTINIERVEAKDYDDFLTQMERRRHRAALEGRRVG